MLMLAAPVRILLAVLLTMASPAWCACALASGGAGDEASGCSETCCPAADDCTPCSDDASDSNESHDEGGLPCRDQSDCSCCDAGSLRPATAAKEIGVPRALLRGDLTPLPAPFQALLVMSANVAAECDAPPIDFAARGSPPLTAATALLLRGCLLLT